MSPLSSIRLAGRAGACAAVAALTLAGAPAWAVVLTLPGAACTSEGAVLRGTSDWALGGALLNVVPSPVLGTTVFHCPVMASLVPSASPNVVTATLNAKLNGSSWQCRLRAVNAQGVMLDDTLVTIPALTVNNGGFHTATFSVTLPQFTQASVNLRCAVPNLVGSTGNAAGVISYRVDD